MHCADGGAPSATLRTLWVALAAPSCQLGIRVPKSGIAAFGTAQGGSDLKCIIDCSATEHRAFCRTAALALSLRKHLKASLHCILGSYLGGVGILCGGGGGWCGDVDGVWVGVSKANEMENRYKVRKRFARMVFFRDLKCICVCGDSDPRSDPLKAPFVHSLCMHPHLCLPW